MSKRYKQLKKVKNFDDFISIISYEIETFDFRFIGNYLKDLNDSLEKVKLVNDNEIKDKILKCAQYIDKECYEDDLQKHLQTSYIVTVGYLYSQFYDDVKDKSFDKMMLLSSILYRRTDDFYALQTVKYFDDSILDRIISKTDKFREQHDIVELVHSNIPSGSDITKKSIEEFVFNENYMLDNHSKDELLKMESERRRELFKNVVY